MIPYMLQNVLIVILVNCFAWRTNFLMNPTLRVGVLLVYSYRSIWLDRFLWTFRLLVLPPNGRLFYLAVVKHSFRLPTSAFWCCF